MNTKVYYEVDKEWYDRTADTFVSYESEYERFETEQEAREFVKDNMLHLDDNEAFSLMKNEYDPETNELVESKEIDLFEQNPDIYKNKGF